MKIYKDRQGGTWVYWTYCDGYKIQLSEKTVKRECTRGAKIITASS